MVDKEDPKSVEEQIAKYYFKCHLTVEPVFDFSREELDLIAQANGFKLATLLMQKRQEEDTPERSKNDTFMTAHSKSLNDIIQRMKDCVTALAIAGFDVWSYKIEDTVMDSRNEDVLNILEIRNITHVAVRYQGKVYSLPKPNRHHDVLRTIVGGLNGHSQEGFLLDNGRFVNRRQAYYIAVKTGQISRREGSQHYQGNELFSEDLW